MQILKAFKQIRLRKSTRNISENHINQRKKTGLKNGSNHNAGKTVRKCGQMLVRVGRI